MATLALQPLRFDKSVSGNSPEFDQITTSGTIIPGDLLTKANQVASTVTTYNSPATVSYLAVCNDSDTIPGLSNQINVLKIRPGDTYEITAHHTTASSAVFPDSALDENADYGLLKTTVSGVAAWCVDLQDTSTKRVRVFERISSATDLYPRLRVQFLEGDLNFNP